MLYKVHVFQVVVTGTQTHEHDILVPIIPHLPIKSHPSTHHAHLHSNNFSILPSRNTSPSASTVRVINFTARCRLISAKVLFSTPTRCRNVHGGLVRHCFLGPANDAVTDTLHWKVSGSDEDNVAFTYSEGGRYGMYIDSFLLTKASRSYVHSAAAFW